MIELQLQPIGEQIMKLFDKTRQVGLHARDLWWYQLSHFDELIE